jgi:Rps23 Pro-64 3,4-dihydroxylase Tpa1-like proline 4-hydroxylase
MSLIAGIQSDQSQPPESIDLNPRSDRDSLSASFAARRRVRIHDLLHPRCAVALHRHLTDDVPWSTLLIANDERWGAGPEATNPEGREQVQAMLERAHEGVRNGFACVYEVDRFAPMQRDHNRSDRPCTVFEGFGALINSPAFLELMRAVTKCEFIDRAEILATRYRIGHFASGYSICAHPAEHRRYAAFALHLTPRWRPEWGGLLEFGAAGGYEVDAYVPAFNVLDVFALPARHWVSAIAPYAEGARLTIEGWLCGQQ